jgi:adenylate cyclase
VLRLGSGASFFVVITLFVLLCFGSWLLFAKAFYIVDLSSLILGLIVAWLAGLTLSYTMEGKNKRELRMIFSKYLHPDLVDRIVENPYLVTMGGEELSVTVMFSDIYNFTGFSEKHNPQELVSYLNEYFATFTNSILDHNGLLDKYTGDGLMAVFGAPIARTDHALSACLAALSHRKMAMQAADKKNLSPAEFFHLNTRLGINTGSVVAGNIGSSRRMEYTSIGDAVNLAARLEGVNKVFQTHIIVAESTWNEVHEVILCRELDTLRVKGKEQGTRIFELIGEIKELDLAEYGWIEDYVSALNLYRKGEFSDAALRFKELFPDPPAQTMYNRCQRLLQYPPENWDGIYTLEEK